jgi:hypothetical protein
MIRTVPIPKDSRIGRLGCSPGGSCCSECAGETGPPIGPAATHTHAIPTGRNAALRRALGDVTCDSAGNCYDVSYSITYGDPVASGGSNIMTGPAVNLNDPALQMDSSSTGISAAGITGGIKPAWLYLGGALILVALLEATSRRR